MYSIYLRGKISLLVWLFVIMIKLTRWAQAISIFLSGSFSVAFGDHLRSRIICGPFWGSFAVEDHLRYRTVLYRSLVIPRYEVLTGSWEGGIEPITMLETRSHPPEMKSCFLIRKNNRFLRRHTLGKNWPGSKQCLFSTMPRQICIILFSIY